MVACELASPTEVDRRCEDCQARGDVLRLPSRLPLERPLRLLRWPLR